MTNKKVNVLFTYQWKILYQPEISETYWNFGRGGWRDDSSG